jgi:hypothetical protein
MDFAAFEARIAALARDLAPPEREGLAAVEASPASPAQAVAPALPLLVERARREDGAEVIRLHHGALLRAAAGAGAPDADRLLDAAFERAVQERVDDRAAAAELPRSDDLWRAHARFRLGEPLPAGWYRLGEPLAPGAWAVDDDVFVEVALPAAAWRALAGSTLALALGDERLEVEVPGLPAPDEVWTVEGAGLFEPDPGVEVEDLEEGDDEVPGRFGDLHLVPVVYDGG